MEPTRTPRTSKDNISVQINFKTLNQLVQTSKLLYIAHRDGLVDTSIKLEPFVIDHLEKCILDGEMVLDEYGDITS